MPTFDPKTLTISVLDDNGQEIGVVWFKNGFYMWEDKVNLPHTSEHRYEHPIHALAVLFDKLVP